jgi:hypothetical protein
MKKLIGLSLVAVLGLVMASESFALGSFIIIAPNLKLGSTVTALMIAQQRAAQIWTPISTIPATNGYNPNTQGGCVTSRGGSSVPRH